MRKWFVKISIASAFVPLIMTTVGAAMLALYAMNDASVVGIISRMAVPVIAGGAVYRASRIGLAVAKTGQLP